MSISVKHNFFQTISEGEELSTFCSKKLGVHLNFGRFFRYSLHSVVSWVGFLHTLTHTSNSKKNDQRLDSNIARNIHVTNEISWLVLLQKQKKGFEFKLYKEKMVAGKTITGKASFR